MNESKRIAAWRRLYAAARRGYSAFARLHKEGPSLPEDRWLHTCSKDEQMWEGVRGISLMLREPGKFTECYAQYDEPAFVMKAGDDHGSN